MTSSGIWKFWKLLPKCKNFRISKSSWNNITASQKDRREWRLLRYKRVIMHLIPLILYYYYYQFGWKSHLKTGRKIDTMLKSVNSNQKARAFSVPRIIIILINLLEHGPPHRYINTMSHVLKQKILQVTFVLFLMSPHQILHLIFVYAGNQSWKNMDKRKI